MEVSMHVSINEVIGLVRRSSQRAIDPAIEALVRFSGSLGFV